MSEITRKIKNNNDAQKAYRAHIKNCMELAGKIERAVLDMPANINGNWAKVGDVAHLEDELQAIVDRLYGLGEYAE